MESYVMQMVLDYVFGTVFIYLAPVVILLAILLFGDEIIGLVYRAVRNSTKGRY